MFRDSEAAEAKNCGFETDDLNPEWITELSVIHSEGRPVSNPQCGFETDLLEFYGFIISSLSWSACCDVSVIILQ